MMAVLRRRDTLPLLSARGTGLDGDRPLAATVFGQMRGRLEPRDFTSGTVIPFWVTIILVVIAVIGVTFTGLFWWHSNRRPKARTAEMDEAARALPGPLNQYQIPTLVFQHHEPETHGYFAPVYLNSSDHSDPQLAEQAKIAVRDYMSLDSSADSSIRDVKPPPPVVVNEVRSKA